MNQPTFFEDIYLLNASAYLPGEPVSNDRIDDYIAPLNNSARIKRRILQENGIQQRHYAITSEGKTIISHTDMACHTINSCLQQAKLSTADIDLLTAASSGTDNEKELAWPLDVVGMSSRASRRDGATAAIV